MTKRSWMWMIAGAVLALPMGGAAQGPMGEQGMRAWHEEQLTDFEAMRDKFLALAEAFPEDTWDWTPMDDVRSVRDVMALIVAEGYLFPVLWGVEAPEGVEEAFGAEMERVGAMSRADVIREIERAFEHLVTSTRDLDVGAAGFGGELVRAAHQRRGRARSRQRRYARTPGPGHRLRAHESHRAPLEPLGSGNLASTPPIVNPGTDQIDIGGSGGWGIGRSTRSTRGRPARSKRYPLVHLHCTLGIGLRSQSA